VVLYGKLEPMPLGYLAVLFVMASDVNTEVLKI
jgi:hypothetical protein